MSKAYSTPEDNHTAKELGITVKQLREDRKAEDLNELYKELTTESTKPRTVEQLLRTTRALLATRKFTGDSPNVRRRQHTEETIVLAVAVVLLDAGFSLGVNDGEEITIHHSTDIAAIQKALFSTDEDYLYVYRKAGNKKDVRPDFWVRCIYGNDGYDVISDYASAKDLGPFIGEDTAIAELQRLAEEGRI